MRRRFWYEAGLGVAAAALLLLTAVVPDWVEVVFGIEPDAGDGSFEWMLVAVLAACAVTFSVAARSEWRRGGGQRTESGEHGRG